MTIKVRARQSFIDLSIQYLGSVEAIFDIYDAIDNEEIKSIPYLLDAKDIYIDGSKVQDINITKRYKDDAVIVANSRV